MVTFEDIRNNADSDVHREGGNENRAFWLHQNIRIGHATKVSGHGGEDSGRTELRRENGGTGAHCGLYARYNCVNRTDHAHSGAIMAMTICGAWAWTRRKSRLSSRRLATTTKDGTAVDAASAALILADKTDVRRNRVWGRIEPNSISTTGSILWPSFSVVMDREKAADYAGYPARRRNLLRAGLFRKSF